MSTIHTKYKIHHYDVTCKAYTSTHYSKSCQAKEEIPAVNTIHQIPSAIIRTPHSITGVVYVSKERKREKDILISADAGSTFQVYELNCRVVTHAFLNQEHL